ncbi:DUF1292 domain-containing protein [Cellulosilyticum sp. ST5]|uniref:UPF0473 protein Clole_2387 n=1 Tax=Cellulosilyticum lentocellum (strain ATCC 49066 / DSM 5427 / NCIMB 11756 / RHM5) TaxID=642492 RepID=F2JSX3_CELLD|nr:MULTISPECIES: DUF1292 domain-containing protein [Cellulosilyticum]ADZ84094.1 protein of unknown function DUF1292 [Cellulosilyticum lentocellum DSM 5427]QEH69541.1 DUF1292 domain-containing protein [Cellulosilyticum sp. WCF-2]
MEDNKNCGCGCGCGHEEENTSGCGCGHDHDEEETLIYVTFEDEDQEVACSVLSIFECDGREYIALAPKEEVENADEAEVLFYRFSEDGDDVQLDDIETDEEWDKVASVFDEEFFGPFDDEEE